MLRPRTGITIQCETISNTGVTGIIAGDGIVADARTGSVTISAVPGSGDITGVEAGPGIGIDSAIPSRPRIDNLGIIELVQGNGVTISGPASSPTVSKIPKAPLETFSILSGSASYLIGANVGAPITNWTFSTLGYPSLTPGTCFDATSAGVVTPGSQDVYQVGYTGIYKLDMAAYFPADTSQGIYDFIVFKYVGSTGTYLGQIADNVFVGSFRTLSLSSLVKLTAGDRIVVYVLGRSLTPRQVLVAPVILPDGTVFPNLLLSLRYLASA